MVQQASPAAVTREEKRLLALQLREGGARYREIAQQVDVSVSTAHELVKEALDELHEKVIEKAEHLRALENSRLDEMWRGLILRKDGDTPRVVEAKLKIMERRARLNGLDAPMAISGPGGGPIPFQSTDPRDAIRARVTAIRARIGGGEGLAAAVEAVVMEIETTRAAEATNGTNGDHADPPPALPEQPPQNGDTPHA